MVWGKSWSITGSRNDNGAVALSVYRPMQWTWCLWVMVAVSEKGVTVPGFVNANLEGTEVDTKAEEKIAQDVLVWWKFNQRLAIWKE